ncbi:MAG TPA: SDR family oxidoreductase [Steroidobacteraceae bacterium]|nr:SDR family oxidoreductase [Steroidobacteraceae bacterium]
MSFRDRADDAAAVVRSIQEGGGKAIALRADTSREHQVIELFETAQAQLGPIQGLVNNAGVLGGAAAVEGITAPILNAVLNTNVMGCFFCAREAVLRMSRKHGGNGGAIVNVSSIAAQTGAPGGAVHYAASKAAVDAFTKGLAVEVAEQGIRVNAVRPGVIDTEMHASVNMPGRAKELAPLIPLKRPGDPKEVAQAVVWLLSNEASYVTGAILDVTGGRFG